MRQPHLDEHRGRPEGVVPKGDGGMPSQVSRCLALALERLYERPPISGGFGTVRKLCVVLHGFANHGECTMTANVLLSVQFMASTRKDQQK